MKGGTLGGFYSSRACTAETCTNVSTFPCKLGVPNAAAALGWKPGLGAAAAAAAQASNEAERLHQDSSV